MITITIGASKGGVHKTTLSVNLADGLKRSGYKVLFVDTDQQCNSTKTYDAKIDGVYTLYDALTGHEPVSDCIQHTKMGDIIASDPSLGLIMADLMNRTRLLSEVIDKVRTDYDFCIIDTPPSLGPFLLSALVASDYTIIPAVPEPYCIQGIPPMLNMVNNIINSSNPQTSNPDLAVLGIIYTGYDSRTSLGRSTYRDLVADGERNGYRVFKSQIREAQCLVKAQSIETSEEFPTRSIYDCYPQENVTHDYVKWVKEILTILGGN